MLSSGISSSQQVSILDNGSHWSFGCIHNTYFPSSLPAAMAEAIFMDQPPVRYDEFFSSRPSVWAVLCFFHLVIWTNSPDLSSRLSFSSGDLHLFSQETIPVRLNAWMAQILAPHDTRHAADRDPLPDCPFSYIIYKVSIFSREKRGSPRLTMKEAQ
jgi:hypothetical protein